VEGGFALVVSACLCMNACVYDWNVLCVCVCVRLFSCCLADGLSVIFLQQRRYCREYANLLTLWGKPYSRAELLKFTTSGDRDSVGSHSGLVVEVLVSFPRSHVWMKCVDFV
jgi:hypothetical protein